jgi:anti-anti-sigma factor
MAKRILLPPEKRVVPEIIINYAFRRIVARVPKGEVTLFSKFLHRLNTSIPIKDKKNLIPTFVDSTFEKSQQLLKEAGNFLKVRATHNERIRTLVIKLEGALDLNSAKKFIKSLRSSLKKAQGRIIIDLKGIQFLSPKAANLLVMKNFKRLSRKRDQIKIEHLNQITSGAFANIKHLISGYESGEAEGIPPKEIGTHTLQDQL